MRFGTAFKKAVKYHAVASLPTLVGGAIVAVALWVGLIEPALASLGGATGGPQQLFEAVIAAPINIPVLVVGVVGGLVVRRVGRTTLLFRIHGTGVVNTVEREVVPDQPTADRSAVDGGGVEGDDGGVADGSAGSDDGEGFDDQGFDDEGSDDEGSDDNDEKIDDEQSDDGTAASSVESEPRTDR